MEPRAADPRGSGRRLHEDQDAGRPRRRRPALPDRLHGHLLLHSGGGPGPLLRSARRHRGRTRGVLRRELRRHHGAQRQPHRPRLRGHGAGSRLRGAAGHRAAVTDRDAARGDRTRHRRDPLRHPPGRLRGHPLPALARPRPGKRRNVPGGARTGVLQSRAGRHLLPRLRQLPAFDREPAPPRRRDDRRRLGRRDPGWARRAPGRICPRGGAGFGATTRVLHPAAGFRGDAGRRVLRTGVLPRALPRRLPVRSRRP